MRVALLMGGISSEREISLRTGAAVSRALRALGHEVHEIDAGRDVADGLRAVRPEAAFIGLHGRFGEDGCVQGLLELLGIPYTGSGVLASALAMDKVMSKRLFAAAGLPVAPGVDGPALDLAARTPASLGLDLPVVVKPRSEGSSVGVSIVREEAAYAEAVARAAAHGPQVLVEKYVAGREVHVGILEGKVLGAIEIVPGGEFYDYQAKYERGDTRYIFPARLSEEVYGAACEAARRAHEALGCRGVTRTDLIVTPEGNPVLLEVNTLPGMTERSLIPKIAAGIGMSFEELCEALLREARLGP
jgi:D-alanine-D-alanine ligase